MIQDILPLHLQNQYEKKQPDDTSYMMIYRENKILVREGETLAFLTYRELQEICETAGEMAPQSIYLFSVGEETYFLTELPEHLIAGFTEIGETAEETVMREVQEEVGLKVKNIHYYKSQPWGFDQNLLLGYFCELDGERDIVLDTGELATAEWVHYSDVPEDPEGLSLTREMMSVFQNNFMSAKMS